MGGGIRTRGATRADLTPAGVSNPYENCKTGVLYYDGEDPFDVPVPVEDRTFPGCVIEVRPVSLMRLDDGEQDDEVFAVPIEDPRRDRIEDLDDIPQQILDESAT